MNRTDERIPIWDFLLAGGASAIAGYAAGMGIYNSTIAFLVSGMAIAGSLLGFLLCWRLPALSKNGGFLYILVIAGAVIFANPLNGLLPDDGFPEVLVIAASLTWMLILGSLFAWSEGTLLFQAVPGVALFGMVGTWDTFRGAPFLFFAFLVCATALLARTHNRTMVRMARSSGYTDLRRIRLGPWRGQAGPSWTLILAFVVVLASLLGAPVIQSTVEPVAKAVSVSLPSRMLPRAPQQGRTARADSYSSTVGTGPVYLSRAEVMRINLRQPFYLRSLSYQTFDGQRWTMTTDVPSSQAAGRSQGRQPQSGDAFWEWWSGIDNPKTLSYRFEILTSAYSRYPLPGVPIEVVPLMARTENWRGGLATSGRVSFRGRSLVPPEGAIPENSERNLLQTGAGLLVSPISTQRVQEFAQKAASSGKTDYEKALLIQQAIERQAVYNTNAAATPEGKDAVDYFLFESKEGYCDLFASAMVAGARAIGLPARYSVGLYPTNNERDEREWQVLRENEFHAWAEILFEDVGWVAFDATEGARVVDDDVSEGRGSSAWTKSPFVKRLLDGAIVVTGLALLLGVVWLVRPSRNRVAKPKAHVAQNACRRYVRAIERHTGRRRSLDQTLDEFVAEALPSLGSATDEAVAVLSILERALYSADDLDTQEAARIESYVAAFAKALRAVPKPDDRSGPSWRRALKGLRHIVREERKA